MMKRIVMLMILCSLVVSGTAQKKNKNAAGLSKDELAAYDIEIRKMVNYLQETLNFIGDPTQSAQEKEIVFSQSYTKIFKDDKVQIEDDLDTKRNTNLSKDVQAYLKDVDFFFKKATFTFNVQSIEHHIKDDGSPYFKVTINRQLVGTTVTNDSINEMKVRYMEINLDKRNNDLRIASIYTTKVNERESLRYWWNAMPNSWKSYFAKNDSINKRIPMKDIFINEKDFIYTYTEMIQTDSGMVAEWKEATYTEGMEEVYRRLKDFSLTQAIDLSNDENMTTLEPLSELSDLTSLNISNTGIVDLTPLRNANKLKVLKANNTQINDLTPLKFDFMLEELDISNTEVADISIFEILDKMEKLNISNTQVSNLKPIENCTGLAYLIAEGTKITNVSSIGKLENLTTLNIGNTGIRDLSPISNLKSLQSLNVSNTSISNLNALTELENLHELYCSNTAIGDLTPLKNHRHLSKIYCNNTRIGNTQASEFSKENPTTLVIYNTDALNAWWNQVNDTYKTVFAKKIGFEGNPDTEHLHAVINITELDLSNKELESLDNLSKLTNLMHLNLANNNISDLSPLAGLINLESINLENTMVEDLGPLADKNRLKTLNINNTPVGNLGPLATDSHLEVVLADLSQVDAQQVQALKTALPNVFVVYQSDKLQDWWNVLDETWQELLKEQIGCTSFEPSDLELQKIQDITEFNVEQENLIQTLTPIKDFRWLQKINVANQSLQDIGPLSDKLFLQELLLQNNPITDLSPLENDTLIRVLNIENTNVSKLTSLGNLKHLRVLNAAGTSIGGKSLKPLEKMLELEELAVNNTDVKKISYVEDIPSLKLLKIYKTKVSKNTVTALQQKRFDLNIIYY